MRFKQWGVLVNPVLTILNLTFTTMKNKLILLASITSVIFSITAHAQWVRVANGIPAGASITSLVTIDTSLFAGTDMGGYRSDDLGTTWRLCTHFPSLPTQDSTKTFIKFFSEGLKLYANNANGRNTFFVSTDNGNSWSWDTAGLNGSRVWAVASDGATTYLGSDGGLYQWSDKNKQWMVAVGDFPNGYEVANILVHDSDVIAQILASPHANLFHSTDHGSSWNLLPGQPFGGTEALTSILLLNSTILATDVSSLAVSSDYGSHWNEQRVSGLYTTWLLSLTTDGHNLFLGTRDSGVYISSDNGGSFSPMHNGLYHADVATLTVLGGFIFAGTSQGSGTYASDWGVWRRPLSDSANAGVAQGVPTSFELSPNPTSGMLTIHNAPPESHVTVMNMLGQSVLEVANSSSPDFTIDLSHLQPGAYCVRLVSPSASITKMIVRE